jgi:hypothetical protein
MYQVLYCAGNTKTSETQLVGPQLVAVIIPIIVTVLGDPIGWKRDLGEWGSLPQRKTI